MAAACVMPNPSGPVLRLTPPRGKPGYRNGRCPSFQRGLDPRTSQSLVSLGTPHVFCLGQDIPRGTAFHRQRCIFFSVYLASALVYMRGNQLGSVWLWSRSQSWFGSSETPTDDRSWTTVNFLPGLYYGVQLTSMSIKSPILCLNWINGNLAFDQGRHFIE